MRMRGGCICSEECAAIYDANSQADLEEARALLPEAASVWIEDQRIMFRFGNGDDAWFGEITRRDPQWFTKR